MTIQHFVRPRGGANL